MIKKMKKRKLPTCQYCGSTAVLRPANEIYADGDPNRHLCVCSRYPECDAYVSVDERTLEPLGTLANGDLRHKRILAHRLFDQIWRGHIMTRENAYRWLREKYGLRKDQAHIARFNDYLCDELIKDCRKALQANHMAS